MAVAVKNEYTTRMNVGQLEVRTKVLEGLEQIKLGKTKDFHEVCDRLEKKYRDAALYCR